MYDRGRHSHSHYFHGRGFKIDGSCELNLDLSKEARRACRCAPSLHYENDCLRWPDWRGYNL